MRLCLTQRISRILRYQVSIELSPQCVKWRTWNKPFFLSLPTIIVAKERCMASQVIMPKLSPTMEEGVVSRWLKKEGDKVSMGEPLAEIDTDKATMEMQALANGVLRKILINEGESAPLGQTIAIIGEPDEDISELLKSAQTAKPEKAAEAPQSPPESDAAPAVEEPP